MNDKYLDIRCILWYSFISSIIWSVGFTISFILPHESLYSINYDEYELTHHKSHTCPITISSKELTTLVIYSNLKCIAFNAFGFVSLGFTTFLNLLFNGFVHGASIRFWTIIIGQDAWNRILPHSFELVGIFISGGVGFFCLSFLTKFIRGKDYKVNRWIYTSLFFTFVACIIIIIAGFIEGYISLYR